MLKVQMFLFNCKLLHYVNASMVRQLLPSEAIIFVVVLSFTEALQPGLSSTVTVGFA